MHSSDLTKSCFSGLAGLGLAHLTSAASTNCDLFEESKLCISHLSNLIYRQPTTDELVCQDLCQSHLACSHFTFMEGSYPLVTGAPDLQCYLWRKCISKAGFIQLLIFSHFPFKVPCSTMDCSSSVAGLKQPSMVDSCCSQFQSGVCK